MKTLSSFRRIARPLGLLGAGLAHGSRSVRVVLTAWCAISVLALLPAVAQRSRLTTIRNFKIIERFAVHELAAGQTNQIKTILFGAEAQQEHLGALARVKQMRIEQYRPAGDTNFIVRAPECWFDMRDRLASSTGQLEVASADGRFRISGQEGFTCSLTNFHIIISNRVRTEIQQTLARFVRP